jgi:hypothetical protein
MFKKFTLNTKQMFFCTCEKLSCFREHWQPNKRTQAGEGCLKFGLGTLGASVKIRAQGLILKRPNGQFGEKVKRLLWRGGCPRSSGRGCKKKESVCVFWHVFSLL